MKYDSVHDEPDFIMSLVPCNIPHGPFFPFSFFERSRVGVQNYICLILFAYFIISCSVLGKRLGKSMGIVAKEVKAMSQEDILTFQKAGEVTIGTHGLKLNDIKVSQVMLVD